MKHYLLAALLLATGCNQSTETTNQTAATSCPEISEAATATAGQQMRVYFTVPGFNPQKKECWAALREAAKEDASTGASKKVIAFIDAPTFTPGKDGMYDNDDKVRDRVIAQVLVNNDAGLFEFTPDPFGGGKYTEPK